MAQPAALEIQPPAVGPGSDMNRRISAAGMSLIIARSEEARLTIQCRRHPEDDALRYRWAKSREWLQECQKSYVECVAYAGFPDVAIRMVVESQW